MRVVADTNVVVSALLWTGIPHRLLRAAETGRITCYASPALIEELTGVLARPKFTARLQSLHVNAEEMIAGYVRLAHVVLPQPIPPVVLEDPEDDAVLACALAAKATYVVSGDPHLLTLKQYRSIHIVSPRSFISMILQ